MSEAIEQEIQAIKVILEALQPLSETARQSVLEYVVKRLGASAGGQLAALTVKSDAARGAAPPGAAAQLHIKEFAKQKRPRSANEMAALVAYYLATLAPQDQRKDTINTQDIKTYFRIAQFRPPPKQIRVTLQNALNAGYLDSAGEGEYRLNPVGRNLVVHSMPRGKGADGKRTQKERGHRSARRKTRG